MSDLISLSLDQKSNIAELNSLSLFDYERAFNKYYNHIKKSKPKSEIYKWFDQLNHQEPNNFFLRDFEDYFMNFIFKSSK
jgi:hypothetical protein